MTTRKPDIIWQMTRMKDEMNNRKMFISSAKDELDKLRFVVKSGKGTKKTVARVKELGEIIEGHKKWIADAEKKLKDFYKPGIVIDAE